MSANYELLSTNVRQQVSELDLTAAPDVPLKSKSRCWKQVKVSWELDGIILLTGIYMKMLLLLDRQPLLSCFHG
jgi:hypothetical protein